jgi:hypothetical protein
MTFYYISEFETTLEIPDSQEVIAASLSHKDHGRHLALVEAPEPPTSEGIADDPICGYPTDSGECQRGVSDPDERCWQHSDDD